MWTYILLLKKVGVGLLGVLWACQLCVHQQTPVAEERGLPAVDPVLGPDSCTQKQHKILPRGRENICEEDVRMVCT